MLSGTNESAPNSLNQKERSVQDELCSVIECWRSICSENKNGKETSTHSTNKVV